MLTFAKTILLFLIISKCYQVDTKDDPSYDSSALTPREWYLNYTCSSVPTESTLISRFKHFVDPNDCEREPTAWRWKYIDELTPAFKFLIREDSIDERLSNVIYTTMASKVFDIDAFKFNSGNPKEDDENRRQVAGPQVDDQLCGRHLEQILGLMEDLNKRLDKKRRGQIKSMNPNETHIRLARFLDSFGRYDSGHLSGRFRSLGSYEQCSSGQLLLPSTGKSSQFELIQSHFCWARLRIDCHLDQSLKSRQKTKFETKDNVISSGICLPDSCHSKSFNQNKHLIQKLVDSQFKLPKSIYLDENLKLDSVFCLVDNKSQFGMPISGKLFLVSLIAWILLTVHATWRHSGRTKGNKSKRSWNKLMENLNLNESWKEFTGDARNAPKIKHVHLDALNFLKVLFSFLIITFHSYIVHLSNSMDELRLWAQSDMDPHLTATYFLTYMVDSFFVITGLLVAHQNMRNKGTANKSGKKRKISLTSFGRQWFSLALSRYIRLVPLLAITFWFKKSVFIYMGSGPLWDFGFNKETSHGACVRESWLSPFTFMSAYLPLSKQCLLQSWSVSNDLFFFIIASPIIVLLSMRYKISAIILSTLAYITSIILTFASHFRVNPQDDWDFIDLRVFGAMRSLNILSSNYTGLHFRVLPILVGVFAGYHLFCHDQRKKFRHWPNWFKGPATWLSFAYIILTYLTTFLLPYYKKMISPFHRILYVHLMTNSRVLWSLASAVVFIRLMTDWKNSRFVQFSTSKNWKAMSRLNYAILLVHIDVMVFNMQTSSSTINFSSGAFFTGATTAYMICLPICIFLNVFIENPINRLFKLALANNH